MLVEAFLTPHKARSRSPSPVHPSSCIDPAIQISGQSIVSAQSHLFLLFLSALVYHPQPNNQEQTKCSEEEEVVVEDALTALLIRSSRVCQREERAGTLRRVVHGCS